MELSKPELEHQLARLLLAKPQEFGSLDLSILQDETVCDILRTASKLHLIGEPVRPESFPDAHKHIVAEMLEDCERGSVTRVYMQLYQLWLRRRATDIADRFHRSFHDSEQDPDSLLSRLESEVLSIRNFKSGEILPGNDTTQLREHLQWRIENPGVLLGPRFGYPELEEMLDGLAPAYYIFGGRPSVGKTTWMTNLIRNLCRENVCVGAFSMEGHRMTLQQKLVASMTHVNILKAKDGSFTDKDISSMYAAMDEIDTWNWYCDETPVLELDDFMSRARRLRRNAGVEVIFVDYLQKMRCSRIRDRRLALAEISNSMQELYKELEIPIIALAQLKRKDGYFDRQLKRTVIPEPELQDLREAGELEQDADIVGLLDRDQADASQFATLIIAKNRNGAIGRVHLEFHPEIQLYNEVKKA